MKYIILGEDKKEYGPIDGETLRKWVESGRVLAETPVRNAMIKKWGKAQDLEFLAPSLAMQAEKIEEEKGFKEKGFAAFGFLFRKKESKKPFIEGTSFKNRYLPAAPGMIHRLAVAFSDGMLICCFFIAIFFFSATAVKSGADPNVIFLKAFPLFISGIVVYYGLTLGLYAQTFGMWFWGLIIVRPDLGEVYMGRAYLYTVLMIIFSVTTPFFIFLNPVKRSIPEYLTDTMLIQIAARPKT